MYVCLCALLSPPVENQSVVDLHFRPNSGTRPHLFCSILQVKSMNEHGPATGSESKSSRPPNPQPICGLSCPPVLTTKRLRSIFFPILKNTNVRSRIVKDFELPAPPKAKKLGLCLPVEKVDRKGWIVAPPSPIPSCDLITSLLNIHGNSLDRQHSLASSLWLQPRRKFCPLQSTAWRCAQRWAFVLDWRCLGPENISWSLKTCSGVPWVS